MLQTTRTIRQTFSICFSRFSYCQVYLHGRNRGIRMKNYLHFQHACATLTLPVFITGNHSCAEYLESGTACNNICCYNWYLNTGIKNGFLEQSKDGLQFKMKAASHTEHTKSCTKSLQDFCSVSEAFSKASMRKKSSHKNH